MLKTLIFYLKLSSLCLRLVLNLLSSAVLFLIQKANQKRLFEIMLLILICFIWIFNFYIFKQKNEVKIDLIKAQVIKSSDQNIISTNTILKEKELEEKIKFYQQMQKIGVKNLGLLLNLSELNSIGKDNRSAELYFREAQEIDPKIGYLEN